MRRNEEDFSICPRPQRTLHLNRPSGAGGGGKMLGGCSGVASFEKIMRFKQRERKKIPLSDAKMNKGKIIVRFKCIRGKRENESNLFLYLLFFSFLSPFVFLGVFQEQK